MRSRNEAAKNLPLDGIEDDEGHRTANLVRFGQDVLPESIKVMEKAAFEAGLVLRVPLILASL